MSFALHWEGFIVPVKAVYDAYNYFFGDDEEPAKKASAPATATVKVKPTPPKDLLKAMNFTEIFLSKCISFSNFLRF